MIEGREWRQIITALATAGSYEINGVPYVSFVDVIQVLNSFAESGCRAELGQDHKVRIVTPEPEPPPAPKRDL